MTQNVVRARAGASLTALQYTAVYVDGSDSENVKSWTDPTVTTGLGILLNAPADDGEAEVCVSGFCWAKAGGTIEPFDELMVTTGGVLIAWTAGSAGSLNCPIGRYMPLPRGGFPLPDAASGDLIRVQVYDNKTVRLYIAP